MQWTLDNFNTKMWLKSEKSPSSLKSDFTGAVGSNDCKLWNEVTDAAYSSKCLTQTLYALVTRKTSLVIKRLKIKSAGPFSKNNLAITSPFSIPNISTLQVGQDRDFSNHPLTQFKWKVWPHFKAEIWSKFRLQWQILHVTTIVGLGFSRT
uniref:Uncharacterized protein n=1 Tax=Romanomermis culicivorax TaxID=13658 RepID=A0A915IST8_ROMCU